MKLTQLPRRAAASAGDSVSARWSRRRTGPPAADVGVRRAGRSGTSHWFTVRHVFASRRRSRFKSASERSQWSTKSIVGERCWSRTGRSNVRRGAVDGCPGHRAALAIAATTAEAHGVSQRGDHGCDDESYCCRTFLTRCDHRGCRESECPCGCQVIGMARSMARCSWTCVNSTAGSRDSAAKPLRHRVLGEVERKDLERDDTNRP